MANLVLPDASVGVALKDGRMAPVWYRIVQQWLASFNGLSAGITVAKLPLPSTSNQGARLFVTDATATTFASVVAGGGTNKIPVYCDGSNWRIG